MIILTLSQLTSRHPNTPTTEIEIWAQSSPGPAKPFYINQNKFGIHRVELLGLGGKLDGDIRKISPVVEYLIICWARQWVLHQVGDCAVWRSDVCHY